MGKFKKRLSSVLAVVLTAFTCLSYVPVKATEITPKVTFVGVEHSPLVVGDSETFYLSAKGAEKVQYRVFQNKIGTDKWEELTKGYTAAANANDITPVDGLAKYEAGKYKLSIWVKKADTEGQFKNKTGSYDSYYITYLNCVNKDDNNRVYANGDMNVEKDTYVVGETVKVNGIKDISGMKAPYTYKLHIYDVNNDAWTLDKSTYRDKENLTWVANKPGTYVLDVWAMSSNSTLWAKEAKLNGRIYEAWKLKVITVTEKIDEPEVNIVKDGEIFGSEDAKNPMQINKNVNITAKNVAFNNVNVKGNVIVTGDFTTLNNVKVEGTLVVNPGENGTVNLNNVTADVIEVLSGAANSIHFNNVNAKVLNINSKNLKKVVRVELNGTTNFEKTTVRSNAILEIIKGSFGDVEVLENENKTENLIELIGTFENNIVVKTKATLKAAKDAKISKVVIEPANNEKIILDGTFALVEVNKKAVLAIAENSKIEKITTNISGVALELGKSSIVTTLDQKGHTVTQAGTGKVGVIVNPPTTTPSTGGGFIGDTTVYVQSVTLQSTVEIIKGNDITLQATVLPANASNKTLTWSSSKTDIATVDSTGKVTAIAEGEATITATAVNGKKAECIVTVLPNLGIVTEVNINMLTITLKNSLYANKAVTCTIYDSQNNVVFVEQVNAIDNTTGTVKIQTVLNPGKYYGYVNVAGVGKSKFDGVTVETTTIDSVFSTLAAIAKNQPILKDAIDYTAHTLTLNVNADNENTSLKDIFAIKDNTSNLSTTDKLYLLSLYKSLDSLNVKVNDMTVSSIISDVLKDTKFAGKSLLTVVKELTYADFIMLVNKCEIFKADIAISMGNTDSLTSIVIGDKAIYSTTDKHISREELRTAFGIIGNLSDTTLANLKGKRIVITIGTVEYIIDVK